MNKILYETKYLNFKSTVSQSGSSWCYVARTNDVKGRDSAVVITTIVKYQNKNHFLFLKTKRPPLAAENKSQFCLESPAGLIGDINTKETLIECAKKELKEEAGLISNQMFVELTNSSSSSGLTSETLSYITAYVENYEPKDAISDGGIILDRMLVEANSVYDYFNSLDKKEYSIAAATVCGVFFAIERLKNHNF